MSSSPPSPHDQPVAADAATDVKATQEAAPKRFHVLGESFLLLCIPLLRRISFRNRQRLGALIGTVAGYLPSRSRTIIKAQVARFYPFPGAPSPQAVLRSVSKTVMETLHIPQHYLTEDNHIECNDWELIHTLLAKNKGAVALTAHLGNWEMLAGYMSGHGVPLTVVGRRVNLPRLQKVLEDSRRAIGVHTIWRGSQRTLARDIIQDLRSGRVIAALIDQDTQVESVPSVFLGEMAQTPVSLLRLALRTGTPVVCVFIRRIAEGELKDGKLNDNRFKISVTHLDTEVDESEILSQFHRMLEHEIRLAPDQWVWFHRRWRTREDGTRLSTRQYLQWLSKR